MLSAVQLLKSDPTPLYIQLAHQLSQLIQNNSLPMGSKLPSIRALSKELAINRDTVVSAYALLEKQGLTKSYIGKGTYVAHLQTSLETPPSKRDIPFYCSHLQFPKGTFPSTLCESITTSLVKKEGWDVFADPFHREQNNLRQSIANFFSTLSIEATAAQVRFIPSLEAFFTELLNYHPKPGICVEAYRDLQLSSCLHTLGVKLHEIPLTPQGLDLYALEKCLKTGTISYILVSPCLQNPTGLFYNEKIKARLVELANLYDCYIIEEGTYSDFIYTQDLPSSLFGHFSKERVIYLYQFSKVYLPALSVSFIALPQNLVRPLAAKSLCSFNEHFLHTYMDSPEFQSLRQQLLKENKEKWSFLLQEFSHLSQLIYLSPSQGGLSFWLNPLSLSSQHFTSLLIGEGIFIAPGNLFSITHTTSFMRLSFSHFTLKETYELSQILHRLA